MFFAPSTLNASYQKEDLEGRLKLILQNQTRFLQLSGQSLPITLHADFVLEEFASKRSARPSLGLKDYFEVMHKTWPYSLTLQIHLMGEAGDMSLAREFFEGYEFNSEWKYQVFVKDDELSEWLDFSRFNENVEVGVWYDLEEWEKGVEFDQELYLLMTVRACKSGQALTEDKKRVALNQVESNKFTNFVVDGGWGVDFESSLHNLAVATDSSFWKSF